MQNCTAAGYVRTWFHDTVIQKAHMKAMMYVFQPKAYKVMYPAYLAGEYLSDDLGPFFGHVLVGKNQLYVHLDSKEETPTISFPSGYYEGGAMILPQVGLRFEYVHLLCL